METPGKRYLYVIVSTSNWDGMDTTVVFASRNKKEAINRFYWLYNVSVYKDFLDEFDEPMFNERDMHLSEDSEDSNKINGYFYYTDNDGECDYEICSVKTDAFFGYAAFNKGLEEDYQRTKNQ